MACWKNKHRLKNTETSFMTWMSIYSYSMVIYTTVFIYYGYIIFHYSMSIYIYIPRASMKNWRLSQPNKLPIIRPCSSHPGVDRIWKNPEIFTKMGNILNYLLQDD